MVSNKCQAIVLPVNKNKNNLVDDDGDERTDTRARTASNLNTFVLQQ